MKKKIIISGIVLLFTLGISSCKKVKELLTFTFVDYTEFTIPSSSGINIPLTLGTKDVQSSSTQSYSNNNTRTDLVKDVKLKKLSLSITNPSGKTFSFLKSIHIYISADGVPEMLLASKENITNDVGSVIELIPTNNKLDSYVKTPTYTLRTDVVTDETLFTDITIRADMTFSVMADPI